MRAHHPSCIPEMHRANAHHSANALTWRQMSAYPTSGLATLSVICASDADAVAGERREMGEIAIENLGPA
jgi:hypothetical protein